MNKILKCGLALLCLTAGIAQANDNVVVINPANRPIPVDVLSNYTSPSVTSAPGATPSPSPAKVVNIQGNASGIPVPTTTTPKQLTGAPSTSTPATSDATVFTLAAGEIGFIQNLSADAPLAVKKGASASTSSFNLILSTGVATDDGKGGYIRIADFVGAVSVAKISGTARYIAWKEAP